MQHGIRTDWVDSELPTATRQQSNLWQKSPGMFPKCFRIELRYSVGAMWAVMANRTVKEGEKEVEDTVCWNG